ncbi:MAG TPA: polysaccharide deacetylase family protein, partial [Hyphomicrobium zavarzinii]|nr:polysaccharide deacetylase family protein [Hyphomicrobium zavarzinii]
EQLVQAIMKRLDKKGKGILLMHDIQPHTAKAMPSLLAALKAGGYKIVQMKAKDDLKTLAEYDAMIEKDVKGLPAVGAERPMSSVIKTVPTGQ